MAGSAVSYRSKEGDTVDEIVWRHYGSHVAGALETVLEANPGLADHGPFLPLGTLVQLPEIEVPKEAETVSLWD
ncbi:P2-like protein prophage tail protein X-like protein [Leisingera sp. ANG-M1]|uniref:tail protein X n=1 Tax=Leisingera sp. ANG-M1 TaxID=1577895 RepID=UPI00057FBB9A|nr:tail protein X [Leisingera sp. ANG-M1]KIC09819.1 P2-like protein prophage tail protein X-like protein [Leisingera sp. ANG-M1]